MPKFSHLIVNSCDEHLPNFLNFLNFYLFSLKIWNFQFRALVATALSSFKVVRDGSRQIRLLIEMFWETLLPTNTMEARQGQFLPLEKNQTNPKLFPKVRQLYYQKSSVRQNFCLSKNCFDN